MSSEGADSAGSARRRARPQRHYLPGEARRDRILDVAVDHFSRFGYAGSSLARIAAGAGVSDAGVLHHFRTKRELFDAVIDLREQAFVGEGFELPQTVHDLFRQLARSVRNSVQRPELVRLRAVLSGEALLESNPAGERLRGNLAWIISHLVPIVERGVESGELRPEVEPRQVVLQLMALNDGLRNQWVTSPEIVDLPNDFEAAADALLRSITADGSGLSS
ncbi:bacterial regulatory, tetR family protein [Rhodococcus sp. MTM3W5.2]|uniref:TetR/AcrR family transcriptional regulator n=1 Tax=Rhodococcus sp. MTM3W5.2 TaxID=1805827 RepID=UPI0009793F61|nr:TetR/AcrR family transcriptional regulator [Rhodococcus sp. MTM3W5.2]AQA21220.1 bacterial regulatory, tetR family protein [Rhodococcus sp. MTM3W5.2]